MMTTMARLAIRAIVVGRPAKRAGRARRPGRWRDALLWIGGVFAVALATVLRNPLFLVWRPTAMLLLLGAAPVVVAGLLVARQHRPQRGPRLALILLWLAASLLAACQQRTHLWYKHEVLASDGALERQLGAHLVIGYTDLDEMRTLAERGLIGGIFVGAHNVRERDVAAVRAELDALQALRRQRGLPPLIVATDQEGGIVARVSPPLARHASLAETIADAPTAAIDALAYRYGAEQGRELAALGINVNLAPVADLSSPDRRQPLDFRSLIGQRAIDVDPERVRRAVIGYAHGLEAQGVLATLKHFPGLGTVSGDTHIVPATLPGDPGQLEASDWIPFRAGLQQTRALLMVGHATLTAIDADKPASLSPRVVHEIVRQRWQHDGVLITDDLSMGAVARHGLCSAGIDVVNAGIDLLLVSYDVQQYFTVFQCLLQATRRGEVDRQRLAASDRRLTRLGKAL